MPTILAYRSEDIDREGKPPGEALGYLAPSVGTFYLAGPSSDSDGHASFVWYHEGFIIDFHDHEMRFVGTASPPGGTVAFWVYEILDEDVEDTFYVFLAQAQADADEGYRIFYNIHDENHLWAWDAKTFPGHV